MKRIFALLLTAALCLSFAACAASAAPSVDKPPYLTIGNRTCHCATRNTAGNNRRRRAAVTAVGVAWLNRTRFTRCRIRRYAYVL